MQEFDDAYYMKQALREAFTAEAADEVPVGAIVVSNGRIIARAHNQTEQLNDATAHAEMLAITAASNALGSKILDECILYVTLEPCLMCAGALRWARIGKVVYGASDPKFGFTVFKGVQLHPKTLIISGLLSEECSNILKKYFQRKR